MIRPEWYLLTNFSRPWSAEFEDWLCVRAEDAGDMIRMICLRDGTNHGYNEFHVFDENGEQIVNELGLSSDVYECDLTPCPGCVVVARIKFYALPTNPFALDKRPRPVNCGGIFDQEGEMPVPLQLGATPLNAARQAAMPRTAREAYTYFVGRPVPGQTTISGQAGSPVRPASLQFGLQPDVPFQLTHRARVETRIYVFTALNTGQAKMPQDDEISLAKLDTLASCYVTVDAQEIYPRNFDGVPASWLVAVAVAMKNPTTGVFGEPLASRDLITDLTLTKIKAARFSWKWEYEIAPGDVRVSWYSYNDNNETSENFSQDVNPIFYARERGLNLFDLRSEDRGWCVAVFAVPLLVGRPITNAKKILYTRL